jgi:hypothetical protein
MAAPLQDFARVLGALLRFARLASFTLIGLLAVFIVWRVVEIHALIASWNRAAGLAFLVAIALAFYLFIGRPVARFFAMPVTIRPPRFPPDDERTPRDVVRHLAFVERYIAQLPRNPEWDGDARAATTAIAACRSLVAEARALEAGAVTAFGRRLREFERTHVDPLLAPLDRKAREVIRQEALAVGVATAVSWNGTMDAFLVLWRSCNLASRIARIYYGRPGVRGTLSILRDVSAATLASAYLQDLSQIAGGALGGAFGKTVGAVAGPLMEGGLNAVATLRIGYLTQARCRAFQAWTEKSRTQAVAGAVAEASRHAREVVGDIVRTVGGGMLKLPARILGKAVESLSVLWRSPDDEARTEGAGA